MKRKPNQKRHAGARVKTGSVHLTTRLVGAVAIAGMLLLVIISIINSNSGGSTKPKAVTTLPAALLQAEKTAIKTFDLSLPKKGAGVKWTATKFISGTYGQFVSSAPAAEKGVTVYEISFTGDYHGQLATETAVVSQGKVPETLWVSGAKAVPTPKPTP